jgi:glutamate-1-semialdehyde 2,1-aminomutase
MTLVENAIAGGVFGSFRLPSDLDFTVASAEAGHVRATDGREFVDHVLASGPMLLGHSNARVGQALLDQLKRGTTSYLMNEPALELAECVVRHVPCAETVKLLGDGASATFYALRLARAFTGRPLVLKFEGGYHGYHDYSLQSFNPPPGANGPRADSAGIPPEISGSVLVAPFNDLGGVRAVVERHGDRLAAIIVEPVQRAILPRDGFLQGLREQAYRCGALLVFDEIVTGFRLALGGAQEWFGVTPDLCALGKVLGGGLPLAALAGRADVLHLATPGQAPAGQQVFISGTLNGNPLSAAAGLATLRELEETDALATAHAHGKAVRSGLLALARKHGLPLQVIGPDPFPEPVFASHEIVDYATYMKSDRALSRAFGLELIRRGVFVNPGAKMYLSSAHTAADIERTLSAANEALARL